MFTGTTDKSSPVGSVKDGQVVPLLPILPGFKEAEAAASTPIPCFLHKPSPLSVGRHSIDPTLFALHNEELWPHIEDVLFLEAQLGWAIQPASKCPDLSSGHQGVQGEDDGRA